MESKPMHASRILDKGWQVFAASLFLWANTSLGSPDELHLETPITPLTVPIDFNEVVYAETTQTAEVSFNAKPNREAPDLKRIRLWMLTRMTSRIPGQSNAIGCIGLLR
jgi:hypothetical protein